MSRNYLWTFLPLSPVFTLTENALITLQSGLISSTFHSFIFSRKLAHFSCQIFGGFFCQSTRWFLSQIFAEMFFFYWLFIICWLIGIDVGSMSRDVYLLEGSELLGNGLAGGAGVLLALVHLVPLQNITGINRIKVHINKELRKKKVFRALKKFP